MRPLSIVALPCVFICIFVCAVDAEIYTGVANGIANPRAGALRRRKRRFPVLRKTLPHWEKQHADKVVAAEQPNFEKNYRAGKDATAQRSTIREISGGQASIPNEVFNLVKTIIGAGVFTLPAGIATFANAPLGGIIAAASLLLCTGLMSGYCFSLIGRVCSYTGASSYKEAWSKSMGESTSWIPNISSLCTTLQALVAYSIVLADTIPQLSAAFGTPILSRTQSLLSLSVFVLLPLCMMKTLKSLAPFSLVGIGGIVYTTVVMIIRYFDGSYAPGGKFWSEMLASSNQPSFGSSVALFSPAIFVLASRMSSCYMSHYQAPKLYKELKNNTVQRFQKMVGASYGISFLIYTIIAATGFLTFGEGSCNFVLNNYSSSDPLISGSRAALFLSLVFGYPLTFVGLRDNILDLLQLRNNPKSNDRVLNMCSIFLMGMITTCAYLLKDISTLLSLGGATYANWLTFIYPTLMILSLRKKMPSLKKEVPAVLLTLLVGIGMSAYGTKEFIIDTFF